MAFLICSIIHQDLKFLLNKYDTLHTSSVGFIIVLCVTSFHCT